jgi:hypothetical protein
MLQPVKFQSVGSDFNWTAGCMHVQLTISIIILELCKIFLLSLPPFHILQHYSVQPLSIFSLKYLCTLENISSASLYKPSCILYPPPSSEL